MAGIIPDGENHFVIRPVPGGSLTWAEATYDSLYGTVKSAWTVQEDEVLYRIEIPPNVTAEIQLPGEEGKTLTTGSYTFTENKEEESR